MADLDLFDRDVIDQDELIGDEQIIINENNMDCFEGIENNDPLITTDSSRRGSSDPSGEDDMAMEEMLDLCKPSGSGSKSPAANNNSDKLDMFIEKFMMEDSKEGPSVGGPVAKFFSSKLTKNYGDVRQSSLSMLEGDASPSSVALDKIKNTRIPDNIPVLKPCLVNESIFKAMPPAVKRSNVHGQMTEHAICKSLSIQSRIMDVALKLKEHVKPEGLHLLQDILKNLGESTEFLAFGRARVNDGRKQAIVSSLNNSYRSLASRTSPGDGLLFGSNLGEAMKEVEESNKLTNKLTKPPPSFPSSNTRGNFLGRGQGRGRGQFRRHPYVPRGNSRGRGRGQR